MPAGNTPTPSTCRKNTRPRTPSACRIASGTLRKFTRILVQVEPGCDAWHLRLPRRSSVGGKFGVDSPLEQRGFELRVPRVVKERCGGISYVPARWRWLVRGALSCPRCSRWDPEFESTFLQRGVR